MEENAAESESEHTERETGEGDVGEDTDEEEQQFDISIPATHSYMGSGLQPLGGRLILEAGWTGSIPCISHHGAVFPGETVPMLLTDSSSEAARIVLEERLFALLCPDETGNMVSGYGVVCEVLEAAPEDGGVVARAAHRCRLRRAPRSPLPLSHYCRLQPAEVVVLGEQAPAAPLRRARLASLDPLRRPLAAADHPVERRLRGMDAAVSAWPRFVWELFDYRRLRAALVEHFRDIVHEDKLPGDAVSLSFWVASNLALSARDRLALLVADNALLRLHLAAQAIRRKSVLCCGGCMAGVARREDIFAMSSEGVHSNYTNLGGFMHDIVTVSRATGIKLSGAASAEFSWFPGYTWTIALCAACLAHVGWRFDAEKRNLRPARFYGLCRNTVTPRDAAEPAAPPADPLSGDYAPPAPPAHHAPAAPRTGRYFF